MTKAPRLASRSWGGSLEDFMVHQRRQGAGDLGFGQRALEQRCNARAREALAKHARRTQHAPQRGREQGDARLQHGHDGVGRGLAAASGRADQLLQIERVAVRADHDTPHGLVIDAALQHLLHEPRHGRRRQRPERQLGQVL
jgi:hypothetical protein